MDARQALTDLMDVSSQIESAVVYEESGDVVVATTEDSDRAERFAQAARDLFAAAEEGKRGNERLTHLEVATAEGSVFVVREGSRAIAATTTPDPTVALVFYDLKTCLQNAAEDEKPKRAPRKRATPKAKKDDDET